jgi:hypothetical protein
MIGPKCSCGQATCPTEDDLYWICNNPACDGFKQICRQTTAEDRALIAQMRTLAAEHDKDGAKGR